MTSEPENPVPRASLAFAAGRFWRDVCAVFSGEGLRNGSLLFALALIFGVLCRFWGLNWDEASGVHPDERFCSGLVPQLGLPHSWDEFYNSAISPLNPDNIPNQHYIYGQLPLFLGKIAAIITRHDEGLAFMVVGRALSALFDTGTVLFTFLIARRLVGGRWALFAASMVALSALHVQLSHYFVTDPYAAFFLTASFWAGLRGYQTARSFEIVLMGALWGAAVACKISSLQFAVPILAFLILFGVRRGWDAGIRAAVLCFLFAAFAFRMGDPMVFQGRDWLGFFDLRREPRFAKELAEQVNITNGIADVPFNVQWIGRTPWLYSLYNLWEWCYGWPLVASWGLGTLMLIKRRSAGLVLVALSALIWFGIQGVAYSKFSRYMLPLTPLVAILAAHFWREIEGVWRERAARRALGNEPLLSEVEGQGTQPGQSFGAPTKGRSWATLGACGVVVLTALWCAAVTTIYGRRHPRLLASEWIVNPANIPDGTPVLQETAWDEGLPLWTTGTGQLKVDHIENYEPDSPTKIANTLAKLDQTQWIFISSGRCYQNIPRWPRKWPVTTEFYRALFAGKLGFKIVKEFVSYPSLGPLQFPDDNVEEALRVYDHPRVLLLKKDASYSSAKVYDLLSKVPLYEQQNWVPREAPSVDSSKLVEPPPATSVSESNG